MSYNKFKVAPKSARTLDGIVFASKAEMTRYAELKLLVRAGEIRELELQPEYILQRKFTYQGKTYRAIKYKADFQYFDIKAKRYIVEDVKGMKTPVYNIKKKLLLAQFPGIDFREVVK